MKRVVKKNHIRALAMQRWKREPNVLPLDGARDEYLTPACPLQVAALDGVLSVVVSPDLHRLVFKYDPAAIGPLRILRFVIAMGVDASPIADEPPGSTKAPGSKQAPGSIQTPGSTGDGHGGRRGRGGAVPRGKGAGSPSTRLVAASNALSAAKARVQKHNMAMAGVRGGNRLVGVLSLSGIASPTRDLMRGVSRLPLLL